MECFHTASKEGTRAMLLKQIGHFNEIQGFSQRSL